MGCCVSWRRTRISPRLMADLEIYAHGIAERQVRSANALVDAARAEIMEKSQPGKHEQTTYVIQAAHIQEGEYFSRRVHDDIDGIMEDTKSPPGTERERPGYDRSGEVQAGFR